MLPGESDAPAGIRKDKGDRAIQKEQERQDDQAETSDFFGNGEPEFLERRGQQTDPKTARESDTQSGSKTNISAKTK